MKKQVIIIIFFISALYGFSQNWGANPRYPVVNLATGFNPDPGSFTIYAGGSTNTASLGLGSIAGTSYINASQPDIRINYTAASSGESAFRVFINSEADTSLLVRLPNGQWKWSDDSTGFNPIVDFYPAAPGQYNIWVGTRNSSGSPSTPAVFYFSEMNGTPASPQGSQQLVSVLSPDTTNTSSTTDSGSAGNGAVVNLSQGFSPDPRSVNVYAGGTTSVSGLGITSVNGAIGTCYIDYSNPTITVNFSGTSHSVLRFFVVSSADTEMLIKLPDSTYLWVDDGYITGSGFNPLMDISPAVPGRYDIWIGTYTSVTASNKKPAVFYITQLNGSPNQPQGTASLTPDSQAADADFGIVYKEFAVTGKNYIQDADWNTVVKDIFGPAYRVCDWNDLKKYFSTGGNLTELFNGLCIVKNTNCYITKDGNKRQTGNRHYWASRHDHSKPGGYGAFDNIDNFMLSLGSWYGSYQIIAVKKDFTPIDTGSGILYRGFAVTKTRYKESEDWNAAIYNVFGPDYRVADWNDLKKFYTSGGNLKDLLNGLSIPVKTNCYVTRNGKKAYSGNRHYWASRHDHSKPGGYGAIDNIDNYMVTLGSWYGSYQIIAVNRSFK